MGVILRILLGLAIAGVGVYFVIRTTTILSFFGLVDWAERKIGPGGSNLFYKLMGVLFCLIGFTVATNLWDAFLQATIGTWLFPSQTI